MTPSTTAIGQRVAQGRAAPGTTPRQDLNVGEIERWASVVGGGALALTGLWRGSGLGLLMAGLGGALVYRGLSGHCHLYQSMGVNTSSERHSPVASVAAGAGVKVSEAVTINRPAADLYRFWRDLSNLPRVMRHL